MKKILILLAAICCCGCGEDFSKFVNTPIVETENNTRTKVNYYINYVGPDISVIEIENHLYLVFSGAHKGGIIHAEHCPCKVK